MTLPMATTKTSAKSQRDFVGRLADAGEEALQKLTELPGGQRVATAMNDLRNRVDDLSRKVRGIDELQTRVAKLEREVAALKKSRSSTKASSSTRKTE
jgi:polyhydroxyalkanoate synthesis regulator phasin